MTSFTFNLANIVAKLTIFVTLFISLTVAEAGSVACSEILRQGLASGIPSSELILDLLTLKEMRALDDYTSPSYLTLNPRLRAGLACPQCKVIERALSRLPSYKKTVYRATDAWAENLPEKSFQKGSIFSDKAFLSGSRSLSYAKDFWRRKGTFKELKVENMIIFILNSKNGKAIENSSGANVHEREVVFLPNTNFIVTFVRKNNDESHTIHMDEI